MKRKKIYEKKEKRKTRRNGEDDDEGRDGKERKRERCRPGYKRCPVTPCRGR